MKRMCFLAVFGLFGASLWAGQTAGEEAKLESFIGKWGGYTGSRSTISGSVDIQSRYMHVAVTKSKLGALDLTGTVVGMTRAEPDTTVLKATLRFDKKAGKYLLSYTAKGPSVTDLPLTYTEAEGFSGTMSFTREGKEFTATATIKDKKGVPEWELGCSQGRDSWSFRFGLAKD